MPSVVARRLMATLLGVLSQLGCLYPFSRSSALSQHWALPSHTQARKRHLTQGLVFKGRVHSAEFRETLNNTTRLVSWSRAQAEVRHTGSSLTRCRNKVAGSSRCTAGTRESRDEKICSPSKETRQEEWVTSLLPGLTALLMLGVWDSPGWFWHTFCTLKLFWVVSAT